MTDLYLSDAEKVKVLEVNVKAMAARIEMLTLNLKLLEASANFNQKASEAIKLVTEILRSYGVESGYIEPETYQIVQTNQQLPPYSGVPGEEAERSN